MVSGIKYMKKPSIFTTIYPEKFIDAFKGKKQANIQNLLGSIAILEKSQTSDMSKFALSYNKTKGYASRLRYNDYFPLQNNYNKLLSGKSFQTHGGKKVLDPITQEPKKNPDPVKLGYVIIIDRPYSTKGIPTPQYFLTLKGFFLITGYNLNSDELKSMINNASKISLFFCFIKKVMDDYSISFVREIFIKPIQKVLLRSDIFQGGNMNFYFGNFADAISEAISKKMKAINKKRKEDVNKKPDSYFSEKITKEYMQLHPTRPFSDLVRIKKRDELQDTANIVYQFLLTGIESLMDNVFYSDKPKEDWYDSLVDHFYPKEESKVLFLKFGYDSENILMNKVMQSLSQTYAYFDYGILPYKENKLPRSKAWKRHQKFKRKGSRTKLRNEIDLSNL